MKLLRADFPLIRRSVFLFLLSAILGSMAVIVSRAFIEKAQMEQSLAKQGLQAARNRLSATEASLQDRAIYSARYIELQQRGIMDGLTRETLEKSLQILQTTTLASDLHYMLSPGQPYARTATSSAENPELYRYPLSLRFDLLHTGRLLDIFEELQSVRGGWFVNNHCSLARVQAVPESPALHVECSGTWLSLQANTNS